MVSLRRAVYGVLIAALGVFHGCADVGSSTTYQRPVKVTPLEVVSGGADSTESDPWLLFDRDTTSR